MLWYPTTGDEVKEECERMRMGGEREGRDKGRRAHEEEALVERSNTLLLLLLLLMYPLGSRK